ncbi:MAG: AEC family transporter [Clostridia bacterium]|nr:AEC family transporter [Clostridia bacterium]
MENFLISINAVLPLLLIMGAGYIAKRAGMLGREDVVRFNKIAFQIFMPCLIFYSIYVSDLSQTVRPGFIIYGVGSVFAIYVVSIAFVLVMEKDPGRRGVMIQGLYRGNDVVIGLPIASALIGPENLGPMALLVAILIPVFNILAVITLEIFCGGCINIRKTLLSILKNPLIIGTAIGLAVKALGIELPGFLFEAIKDMGSSATAILLFLLGAFFQFSGMKKHRGDLIIVVIGKLAVLPCITLFAAKALGFRGAEFVALLSCLTAPTAISSFTMAEQMGGDSALAGDIVVWTSALCPVFIFIWAFLFKSLGAY